MTNPHPQPFDPGQRPGKPWRPWQVQDSQATWSSLGAIAHGPVLLARAPGIAIGLRCLLAHPDRLSAWLVASAEAASTPQDLRTRSAGEATAQEDLREHWPEPPGNPVVHASVDRVPQRLFLGERNDARGGDGVRRISCVARIFGLPTDDRLGLRVSWGPALPPTSTTLDLPGLREIAAGAIRFVDGDTDVAIRGEDEGEGDEPGASPR
ncbi:hypothetical protein [Kineococcus sp. SYSU DK005]|uniref:hypothetical protein n=1 Tax=Kineococcus sp. SYSU DK005 TaxID=3383126 RepID=UPI003D7C7B07